MVRMLLLSRTLIGNTAPNTMKRFQRRHYSFIAETLAMSYADEHQIDMWILALQRDNPQFKPTRFIEAIKKSCNELKYIEDTREVTV
jgi:hypothetical protein